MWSLPNIQAMNAKARADAKNEKRRASPVWQAKNLKTSDGKRAACDFCSDKATRGDVYYDIFSDDPKGVVFLCEKCDENYGSAPEGYFECEQCQRLFVENYTWELYRANVEGMTLCLNCYRDWWLHENELVAIQELEGMAYAELFQKYVRKAPHLIAVGQDCPKELVFHGNVEFDIVDGRSISGAMPEALAAARAAGAERVYLIMNAAYQFAVSIGVYSKV